MPSVFEDANDGLRLLLDALKRRLSALPVKTAETMAVATYAVLREAAKAQGQDPDIEVLIRKPGEPRHFRDESCWSVAWEAGPYEWAVPASIVIGTATGKLTEPYYSFDLCFYPGED